jgi:hypothetical protein
MARLLPKSVLIALLAFLIALPFMIYFPAYFVLSRLHFTGVDKSYRRVFRSQWQAEIFKPAAKAEGLITGNDVYVEWIP